MDIEEARALLEVTAETEAKQVRRAYLRRVKQHKPDQDPEGFQRLREAFELASALAGLPLVAPTTEVVPLFEGDSRPDENSETTEGAAIEDQTIEGQAIEGQAIEGQAIEGQAIEDQAIGGDTLWDRCEALLAEYAEDDVEARLTVARDCVESNPDQAEPYWLWTRELARAERHDEIPEVLRRADARGLDSFFENMLFNTPGHLTAEEINRAAATPEPVVQLATAIELARRRDPPRALELVRTALETAVKSAAPVPVILALRVFFELQSEGALKASRQTFELIEQQAELLGERRILPDDQAMQWWILAGELRDLSDDFPEDIRAAIAQSILHADRDLVVAAVHQHVRQFPLLVSRTTSQLAEARNLHNFHGHLLEQPAPRRVVKQSWDPTPWAGVLLILLFFLRSSCGMEVP